MTNISIIYLLQPTGGAKYYGEIVDFKRQGRGIMTYPDGDLYDGNYSQLI